MNTLPPIHICITDDHLCYRDGLKYCIDSFDNFFIDFEAENGNELIIKLQQLKKLPDICLLDISMPVMDGYETIRILNRRWPELKVLVLTQYNDNYIVSNMLAHGARGFLSKNFRREELNNALTNIYNEGYYFSALTPATLFKEINAHKLNAEKITIREKELLKIMCEGFSYQEIADKLHLSLRTVEKHRDNIFQKLQVNSKAELIAFTFRNGLVSISTDSFTDNK